MHRGNPRLRDSFSSLQVRNYRRFQASQLLAHTAGWMQRIATDWLVLEITGNIAAVGLTVFLQWGPMLLLGPYGGVIADRFSKRTLLMGVYAVFGVLSALLATLALTGVVELWHVYVISVIIGCVFVVESPARVVLVSEMVEPKLLQNAISLNASVFHFGGFVGPAVSGVIIALAGSGWAIGVNALAALVVVITLASLRSDELRVIPVQPRQSGQIRQALRYARSKPTIVWPMIMLMFVAVFGMSLPVILTGMANEVYESGSTGYGLYSSLVAIGALTGALVSTRMRTLRLRTIVAAMLVYGVLQALAGLAPWYGAFLALLVGVGLARLVYAIMADSLVQLSCNPGIRGRVMSFYVIIMVGGQALGGPLMGGVAEVLGPSTALIISGTVPAVAAIIIGMLIARSGSLRLQVRLKRGESLVSIVGRSQITPSER
ncbi:MFS transporter [Microcella sp.]|uniref:MFS transporter n=1 Tax=Microcella sp. TaxID=1913979 RepID=UPI003F7138A0